MKALARQGLHRHADYHGDPSNACCSDLLRRLPPNVSYASPDPFAIAQDFAR